MNTYQTNVNSINYRLTHKPAARMCDVCLQVPAVKRVTHRDERDGSYWTANVCDYCAGKVGK
jgi:hypothetical protein